MIRVCRTLALPALVAALLASVRPVGAVVWDLESDTWVADDALGRTLPGLAECGIPKANKTVGIFYFLWLNGAHAGVFDITKILTANPTSPAWGPRWEFHHWGESELGYYTIDEDYVIRRHCQMLVDAGVDVICFDVTNAITYTPSYMKLCSIYRKVRQEGGRTPQVCFMANSSSAATVQKLYDEFYSQSLYPELWFHWLGKPLILSPPDGLSQALLDFFTVRRTWAWNAGQDNWTFIDNYPQNYGWHTPGVPEQISVCVAQHPISNIGRSFHGGSQPASDQYGMCPTAGEGLCFAEQWTRALAVSPPFVFITGWNEWIAQRFIEGLDHDGISLCGRPLNDGESFFVDAYTQEFSRDIEPMKGGHSDNYYYQMIGGIRRYKGVRSAMAPGLERTIAIDGDFSDWKDVQPEYRDFVGDTEHRNSPGYSGVYTYVNNTGRNDFVRLKVARDNDNVYFYVETSEDITARTDPNWMLLFIDSDRGAATGWHGYDYLVNHPPVDATTTTVKSTSGGWNWTQVGTAAYRVAGNQMEIGIPRSMIGQGGSSVALDFHWADNIQAADDITQFFANGDSAPNRRFNYRYDTSAAGPPWEFTSSAEGWSAGHSIMSFKQSSGSIQGTIFRPDPYVNAPSAAGVNADVHRYLTISMRNSSGSANTAELWWKTPDNPSYSPARKVSCPITCDNAYHTYVIDMSANPEWKGWVYALQLHPTAASSGSFYVDYIRIQPDTTPPAGSISINSGAATTNTVAVSLNLSATDTGSGVSKMRLSNDGSAWSTWEDYVVGRSWILTNGNGVKTVYVQFRDLSMNRSVTYTDTIELQVDTVAPSGTITINSGATYANTTNLTLSLWATDDLSGVSEMRLANSGSPWNAWEPFSTSRSWTVGGSDGTKTVYAQFKDAAGNVSATASDSIVLDTVPPTAPGTPSDAGAYTSGPSVVFNWTAASDSRSGIESYFCQVGTSPGSSDVLDGNVGSALTKGITGSAGSRYYCRVRARDGAGNAGLWSGWSDGVSIVAHPGVSISAAKGLFDGDSAGISSRVVTAIFVDRFYVQEMDRSAGLMVKPVNGMPAGLAIGSLVDIGGVLGAVPEPERWVEATVSVLSR